MARDVPRSQRGFFRSLFRLPIILLALLIAGLAAVAWQVLPSRERPSAAVAIYGGEQFQQAGRSLTVPPGDGEISLFVAGDAIITQPWSHITDPQFLRMIDEIRAADVAIGNLETLIHEYRGYAQAESGGTWLASPPEIADELVWAGFDVMAHANNHTFDYGSIGVLETHENASRAGLILAGSGADLQAARAPRYVRHAKGTVALVSMASTFVPFGRASRSRPDLRGRPGLNPLTIVSNAEVRITRATAERLQALAQAVGFTGTRFVAAEFDIWGVPVRVHDSHGLAWGRRIRQDDLEGNLAAVREAARNADIVVLSLHEHWQKGGWLTDFAHQAIDAGADVFFVQGTHSMRGIEIYKGKPIFYGLGDFVFQAELVERLPAEFYEELGLGDDVGPAEAMRRRYMDGAIGFPARRAVWEGVGAALRFKDEQLIELRLLPLDLRFGAPLPQRGRPRAAAGGLAREIIEFIAAQSAEFGTEVLYVETPELGVVRLDTSRRDQP
jgi:poly-gamma-glutamate synthesis protein (capsule biosynthesis protein)